MLIVESKPNQRKPSKQEESKLQVQIVMYYHNESGLPRYHLWSCFSELLATKNGGTLRSMGLIKSLPDLMIMLDVVTGIELKIEGSQHDRQHVIEQCLFMINVLRVGWFCTALDMFKDICAGGVGICPHRVLAYCESVKTKNITWNNMLF